jgi:hypothetical protein
MQSAIGFTEKGWSADADITLKNGNATGFACFKSMFNTEQKLRLPRST